MPDALSAGAATTADQRWAPTDAAGALDDARESLDARVTARRREMVEELVVGRAEADTRVRAASGRRLPSSTPQVPS